MTRILAMLAAGAAIVTVPTAGRAASPDMPAFSPAERSDRYFGFPTTKRDPVIFRALSGQGDPGIFPDDSASEWWAPMRGRDRVYDELGASGAYDCRTDYARQVYAARIARYGHDHPYVRRWLMVQKSVFAACRELNTAAQVLLPAPLPLVDPALAAVQAQDRAYQAASLLFYQGKLASARTAFARIAASASPHHPVARYMVAAIDAGTTPNKVYAHPGDTATALREVQSILADPSLAAVHPMARSLIGWMAYNIDTPELRRMQVDLDLDALEMPSARLASDPAARDLYARAAGDAPHLHGSFPDPAWWLDGASPADAHASRAMAERARRDDLAAWLLMPNSPYERGYWADDVTEGWGDLKNYVDEADKAGKDGLVWHVVARSLATNYDEAGWDEIDALLARARHPGDDAATAALPTLFYHQVRTALMGFDGEGAQFRVALERLAGWPYRGTRYFNQTVNDALRYLMATGRVTEARRLRDAVMPLSKSDYDQDGGLLLLLAEDDGHIAAALAGNQGLAYSPFLNLLSGAALERLAQRHDVPHEIRARFARVAWTRLYARHRTIGSDVDRIMRALNPEVTKDWQSHPGRQNPENKTLLLDVLRSPALNILPESRAGESGVARPGSDYDDTHSLTTLDTFQHSDNNWWCAWQPARHSAAAEDELDTLFHGYDGQISASSRARGALERMLLASMVWQSGDRAETRALAAIDSAPKQLSERAIAWVRHPGLFGARTGQDEALALAVRSTRYGCQRQGGHAAYSRTAFTLLHRQFPTSDAARRTRYWFDCAHFSGGCPAKREEEIKE